jgi:FkbM family methyltransferase
MRWDRSSLRKLGLRVVARVPALAAKLLSYRRATDPVLLNLLRFVPRGGRVLEAGANEGQYTGLLADMVGPRGRLLAIEPVPATFSRLTSRVQESARGWVSLERVALAEQEGQSQMMVPGSDSGQASLRAHDAGSWSRPEREVFDVCVTTVDALMARGALDRLDFCKLDVEGAELPLLRGARATLLRFRPVLLVELSRMWATAFGYQPEDLLTELRELGYRDFLVADRVLRPLSPGDLADMESSINVVARHHPPPEHRS